MKKILVCMAIILFGCDLPKEAVEIFSHPQDIKPDSHSSSVQKISIAATNNFQGKTLSYREFIPIPGKRKPEFFEVGGANLLENYLDILKDKYPKNLLLVDTGHIFDLKSALPKKKMVLNIFEKLKYDGIVFTEQELISIQNDESIMLKRKIPFIASNIINLKTGKALKRRTVHPYRIKKIGDIKVGLIALTMFNTVSKPNKDKLKGVYFEDPVLSFLKTRKLLRKKGADILIILSHLETSCSTTRPQAEKRGSDRGKNQIHCPGSDDLTKFLKRLPVGSVDLVVVGDNHFASGFVGDIPVIQNPGKGKFISTVDIFVDIESKKLLKDKTIIHTPTKLCRTFFLTTNDCHLENESNKLRKVRRKYQAEDEFKIISAKFLGEKIKDK